MKFIYTFLLIFICNLFCNAQNNSQYPKEEELKEQYCTDSEAEKMRETCYQMALSLYGKEHAQRIMSGDLMWGDDEDAVLLAHWYEQGAASGKGDVHTPLGKAFRWSFAITGISYYFINKQLIGISYPSSQPQWVPRGFSYAKKNMNHVLDARDAWGPDLTSSKITSETKMSEEVKGYYDGAIKGDAKKQFQLACCIEDGEGIKQDEMEAVYWYKKSAAQGYTNAEYNLALCYQDGDGTNRNKRKAQELYRKAANKGDAPSQFNLALMYYEGDGIPKNYKNAIFWLKKSINAEDNSIKADSYEILSECYRLGRGVTKNTKEYYRLKKLADKYSKLAEEDE